MQEFHINKDSVLPVLRMELFLDGRYDYNRDLMNNALQDSVITFSMKDCESGTFKILNAEASISEILDGGCNEKYVLEYKWNKRDTKKEGIFEGSFNITFNGNLTDGDGTEYPKGNLIVPIQEKLLIYID